MKYPGKERRSKLRRESDRSVCPYHDLKFQQVCGNLTTNDKDIEEIKKNMVTKADMKSIDGKTRWFLGIFVSTSVIIFLAVMGWIGTKLDTVTKIETNQQILMQAFNIEVSPKDHDQQGK